MILKKFIETIDEEHILSRRGNTTWPVWFDCIGDVPKLGYIKRVDTIEVFEHYTIDDIPALIVHPTSFLDNWLRLLTRVRHGERYYLISAIGVLVTADVEGHEDIFYQRYAWHDPRITTLPEPVKAACAEHAAAIAYHTKHAEPTRKKPVVLTSQHTSYRKFSFWERIKIFFGVPTISKIDVYAHGPVRFVDADVRVSRYMRYHALGADRPSEPYEIPPQDIDHNFPTGP